MILFYKDLEGWVDAEYIKGWTKSKHTTLGHWTIVILNVTSILRPIAVRLRRLYHLLCWDLVESSAGKARRVKEADYSVRTSEKREAMVSMH